MGTTSDSDSGASVDAADGGEVSGVLGCREVFERMCAMTTEGSTVRNFHADIAMGDYVVETDLFPRAALEAYSAWNLEREVSAEQRAMFFSAHRGSDQGDYRDGMRAKIANVVDCLRRFPGSKRAVISVVPRPDAVHADDAQAKCLREIHFYLDSNVVGATVLMRAQAAEIFPKNIHFIGEVMDEVAAELGVGVGTLHYLATVLVSNR